MRRYIDLLLLGVLVILLFSVVYNITHSFWSTVIGAVVLWGLLGIKEKGKK